MPGQINISKRQAVLGVLFIFYVIFGAWALYTFVTSKYPGANDFYQRWRGAKAFWVEGRDPYGADVARDVEIDLYGTPYNPDPALDEYPGDFLYPFHTALLLAPLTPLPYSVASAIWMSLTAATVGLTFVLMADLFNWRPPALLLIFGVAWAITFYPSIRGIFLGQVGTLIVCLQLIIIWALVKHHDIVAGIAIALTTIKPQIGIFLIPFLILWALRFGRWHFLISSVVTMAILMGASFLLEPSWLGKWLTQASQYSGYTRIGSPIWVITNIYLPFLGQPVELLISAVLVVLMLWSWFKMLWRRDQSWLNWTAALTLTVTHLVLVRTATPHFVVFLIVIVFYLRELYRSKGSLPVIAAMLILSVGLWWLFMATLVNRFESAAMYLPLPIGSLLLLLLTRHRWQQTVEELDPSVVPGVSQRIGELSS
jgi:hypothetical protein